MSDSAIKKQIMISLETNHIHNCLIRYYEWSKMRLREKLDHFANRNDLMKLLADSNSIWDWNGIKKRSKIIVIYQYFSTIYMSYVVIRNLSMNFIETSVLPSMNVKLDRPLGCYMLGRFVVQQSIDLNAVCGTLAALANLLWPYFQWARPHKMTTPYFLMFTSRDLTNYYATLRYKKINNSDADFVCAGLPSIDSMRGPSLEDEGPDEDRLKEMFMDEIMCYKVPCFNGCFALRLRSNRTREANSNLRKMTSNFTFYFTSTMMLVAAVVVVVLTTVIFDARRYVREYPGCDHELESEVIGNGVDYYKLITITPNRGLALLADAIENLILWVEMGTYVYGIEFACILHYDLILYWKSIHAKAEALKNQAELLHFSKMTLGHEQKQEFFRYFDTDAVYPKAKELFLYHQTINGDDLNGLRFDLAERMQIFLHETHDFIQEIGKTNLFLSDIISVSLTVWIAIYSSYIYLVSSSSLMGTEGGSEIEMGTHGHSQTKVDPSLAEGWKNAYFLIVPMVLIAMILLALLTLSTSCLKTYSSICSLMAYHQFSEKRAFLPILDCFIENRTCYRLFRMNPFRPITFLSFIGWSFSCFFIIRGLVRIQP